ncbi:MAG: DNA-methyltransferase [Candidatus Hodarchaeales archaeon]
MTRQISRKFDTKSEIILYNGNCLDFLKTIPDKTIDLVISSPPYNIGKVYEKRQSFREYLEKQKPVLEELIRVLASTGSICWQVGNFVKKGEVFPLDIYYYEIFKDLGLYLRNRIIWTFGHGLHASKRLSGRYETILWFTKTDNYKWNLDAIRVPQKYPGKRSYKGQNKGKPSGNPKGKNPSDIWRPSTGKWEKTLEILKEDWTNLVWDIPNVKSNHPEKTIHPCQFPIELVERCILALTEKNDWVLDPYCGVGSTLIAGIKNDRRVIGVDYEANYIKIAEERIEKWFKGSLPYRKLGKKVYKPTGREKVSKIPEEWFKTKETLNKNNRLL